MPLALMVLGFGLVAAGLFFAFGGKAADAAAGQALKGISVSGPSWLILVALGAGVLVFGAWQFEVERTEAVVEVPWTYGDDADLDDLWDSCAEGDWSDCDELYAQSASGSGYEWFGGTCGGLADDPHAVACDD
jgi:hypothetical protein